MSTDQAIEALILAQSDRADAELTLRLEAWRDGWRACQQHQGGAYEAGFADGILAYKHAQHGLVTSLRGHLIRWDGLREHFSRPRPGDKQPATRRPGAAA